MDDLQSKELLTVAYRRGELFGEVWIRGQKRGVCKTREHKEKNYTFGLDVNDYQWYLHETLVTRHKLKLQSTHTSVKSIIRVGRVVAGMVLAWPDNLIPVPMPDGTSSVGWSAGLTDSWLKTKARFEY